jgi:hypothetical protein
MTISLGFIDFVEIDRFIGIMERFYRLTYLLWLVCRDMKLLYLDQNQCLASKLHPPSIRNIKTKHSINQNIHRMSILMINF